jgi:MarR family transcriptional regulator, organic hydroperoxide resistance regulator
MTDFDLTRYLPYLVNRTGVRIATAFGDVLREHGITLPMWRVLAALDHADGQRISDLAALISIDVSTLSRILDAMQEKGLVERRRGKGGDARVVTVHETKAGHELTGKLIPFARHYEEVALRGFTTEETEALKAMLVRVFRNIAALEDEATAEGSTKAA